MSESLSVRVCIDEHLISRLVTMTLTNNLDISPCVPLPHSLVLPLTLSQARRLLCPGFHSVESRLSALVNDVSLDDVLEYGRSLRGRLLPLTLVSGNVQEPTARAVNARVDELVAASTTTTTPASALVPAAPTTFDDRRCVRQLTRGMTLVTRRRHPNVDELNSAAALYIEATDHHAPLDDGPVQLALFVNAMSAPLFAELRTKQQLGYIVWTNKSGIRHMDVSCSRERFRCKTSKGTQARVTHTATHTATHTRHTQTRPHAHSLSLPCFSSRSLLNYSVSSCSHPIL